MNNNKTYRSKTISLAEDVWQRLEQLRKQHGSYNKALRVVLNGKPQRQPSLRKAGK